MALNTTEVEEIVSERQTVLWGLSGTKKIGTNSQTVMLALSPFAKLWSLFECVVCS